MSSLYDRFADIYAAGPYPRYTQAIIEVFPQMLQRYGAPTSGRLLDIACGEGTFAVAMSEQDWEVTGVDQSERMLSYARKKAEENKRAIDFLRQDMRELDFQEDFDVATCWFDSLNYLLHLSDLSLAFSSAYRALKPGGWYFFDMNTIYGLAVQWQQRDTYIQQDSEELLEIHNPSFDYERSIASLHITGFILVPEVQLWERIDEIHYERGYPIEQVTGLVENAGFEIVDVVGSIREFTPPDAETGRIWVVCRKPRGA